ncbi:MAG TPA: glycosyltransferase family 2 protein [Candidatus Dormibacteraeota bacterium]|nr:glycosyltransferase family 2 protein [Candidatus Dormibacteraeota bacterium]
MALRRPQHDPDPHDAPPPRPARTAAERLWGFLIGALVFTSIFIAALPLFAIVRGTSAGIALARAGNATLLEWLGLELALVALGMGAFFFAYSLKYYLATATMLLLAYFGPGRKSPHPALPQRGRDDQLRRIEQRGLDGGLQPAWERRGRFDLGYEPFISIHIATYNEKRVVGRLLEACSKLNYSNYEVILVDDSTDGSMEVLEPWTKVERFKIIHRDTRDGFKGGALTYALRATDPRAEYIAIFDADAVPFPDVLRDLLYHFYSSGGKIPQPIAEIGAVQSYQWHVLNKSESWLTAAVRTEYAGSYMVERPFQQVLGSMKMIAGTAYMIRAGLLKELGWGRSLTEDWELTLRMYAKGYKVVYTPYAETPAECVATFGRLARQRMRWAEGHSYNVNKWFLTILRSRHLSLLEKTEFLYYGLYYLQAALFMLGSGAWLASELVLHVHIPTWTALLGWSLLFSNLFSLPLMNLGGLLLEGSPRKDYNGVLGAVALSFLLVPFQAWASLKGLFERREGPWFRTPKTGRITDHVEHLPQKKSLKRWLRPRPSNTTAAVERPANPRRPSRAFRLVCIVGPILVLTILGLGAATAPTVLAANTYYLHDPNGAYTIDNNSSSNGSPAHFPMDTPGATQAWATTYAYTGQTIPAGSYTFTYWTSGQGNSTVTALLTFGYSATADCTVIVPIATWQSTLVNGGGSTTSTNMPAVLLPASSYLCWQVTVAAVNNGGLDLRYDSNRQQTSITTPSIVVPEHGTPLLGLALLIPLAAQRWIRRPQVRLMVRVR